MKKSSSNSKITSLRKLNSQKFVELIADFLYRDGHSDIKIVDGPGDGCRDIHSMTRNGEKHLTQCKFYNDLLKTVSSREISDLPVGMVKLDYKKGLFATTARISPQAKREFLNDYPGLDLNFIEGKEITRIVFNDLILRAVWYDDKSIDRVSYQIIASFIARDLSEDKPIPLINQKNKTQSGNEVLTPKDGKTGLQVQFKETFVDSSIFEPYRPPIMKTNREWWLPFLLSTEATIEGISLLEELESSVRLVRSFLFNSLKNTFKNKMNYHIALRLGRLHMLSTTRRSARSGSGARRPARTRATHCGGQVS